MQVSDSFAQTRAAALTNYVQVGRFLALDPHEMLRQGKISPWLLDDPDNRISARSVVELFEASAAASHCMSFGLLMAECRDFASLGPVSVLLNYLPTMRDIINGFIEYRILISDILNIQLVDDGNNAEIHWEFSEIAKQQIVENAVGVSYKVFTSAMSGRWQPESVHFRHSAPADLNSTTRISFSASCNLTTPSTAGAVRRIGWMSEIPVRISALARNATKLIELLPKSTKRSMTERTKLAVSLLIPHVELRSKRWPTIWRPSSNLQRQLEEEGQTFASILKSTRRELSVRYLTSSRNSIADIAVLLAIPAPMHSADGLHRFGKSPPQWQNSRDAGIAN